MHKKQRRNQPYVASNKIIKKTEAAPELPELPLLNEEQLLNENNVEQGYVNVGVYTALGALPVGDAVVTVYVTDEEGEEHVLYHLTSNQSGRVPRITLPVVYSPIDPSDSDEYYFSTYNLRIQAIGYYTQNIIDLRVFPDTATNYQVTLVPVAAGGNEDQDRTIVIPPSPIDYSNV